MLSCLIYYNIKKTEKKVALRCIKSPDKLANNKKTKKENHLNWSKAFPTSVRAASIKGSWFSYAIV